LKSEKT